MSDFKTAKLKDLCDTRSGGTPRRGVDGFYGGDIPWAKISDLNDEHLVETEESITQNGLSSIRGRLFAKGTILLAMYGSVGKMAVAGVPLSSNQAILGIRIKRPDQTDPEYIRHWLKWMKPRLEQLAVGVTQKNLSAEKVRDLDVPAPHFSIQEASSEVLGRTEKACMKQRLALACLDAFLAAVFDKMFGDPVTNPKGWPEAAFVSLFRERSAGNARIDTRDYLAEGPVRVVDQGEALVSGFADDPALIADVPLPVIVFGDHTRRFKLIDFPFAVGAQGTKLLAPSARLDPTFAYHQLRVLPLPATGYARHYKFLKSKTLIVPPLAEQERFAEVVRRSEPLRARLVASGARLDALYASLAARAFRGDLRLASDTPTD